MKMDKNKKSKIGVAVLLTAITVSSVAWSFSGPGGFGHGRTFKAGCHGPKHSTASGVSMGQEEVHHLIATLPEEQRNQAHDMMRQHRDGMLEIKQAMSNGHFELMKTVRADKWDENLVVGQAATLATTMQKVMVEKTRLLHQLRQLTRIPAKNKITPTM